MIVNKTRNLTKKACIICTQNSTAMPTDITRFTTDNAFSWILRIAIIPWRCHFVDDKMSLEFQALFKTMQIFTEKENVPKDPRWSLTKQVEVLRKSKSWNAERRKRKTDWITCNHLDKRIVFRQHACTTNLQVITKQTTKTAAVVSQEDDILETVQKKNWMMAIITKRNLTSLEKWLHLLVYQDHED